MTNSTCPKCGREPLFSCRQGICKPAQPQALTQWTETVNSGGMDQRQEADDVREVMIKNGDLRKTPAKEPREWHLAIVDRDGHPILEAFNDSRGAKGESIHVIEKSAYDALKEENERYWKEWSAFASEAERLKEENAELRKLPAEVAHWKTHAEHKHEALEKLKAEVEKWRKAYNAEDRAHVKSLQENDDEIYQLRAELASLQKDHADDWKRIQDAEREAERLREELAEIERIEKGDA